MKRITLANLPKSLEPYRHMITSVDDWRDFTVPADDRQYGDPILIILEPGYHDIEADTHAVVEYTVGAAAETFKRYVRRVTDCEECNEELGRSD